MTQAHYFRRGRLADREESSGTPRLVRLLAWLLRAWPGAVPGLLQLSLSAAAWKVGAPDLSGGHVDRPRVAALPGGWLLRRLSLLSRLEAALGPALEPVLLLACAWASGAGASSAVGAGAWGCVPGCVDPKLRP